MNFIKLTLVSPHGNSGRDVFVNLDLVSEIREVSNGSILFYNFVESPVLEEAAKVKVNETLADIQKLIAVAGE